MVPVMFPPSCGQTGHVCRRQQEQTKRDRAADQAKQEQRQKHTGIGHLRTNQIKLLQVLKLAHGCWNRPLNVQVCNMYVGDVAITTKLIINYMPVTRSAATSIASFPDH